MQHVVKPVVSNRFDNRLNSRLYRVHKHPTGCETGCQTGLIANRLDVCLHDAAGCPTGCTAVSCKLRSIRLKPGNAETGQTTFG